MSGSNTTSSLEPEKYAEQPFAASSYALAEAAAVPAAPLSGVLVLGDYLVGEVKDGLLGGHPDIRY